MTVPLAAVLLLLTTIEGAADITPRMREFEWPAPVQAAREWAGPFRSANGYGLFRVMTPERLEMIVEGSRDGRTWVPYEFAWKPGDVHRRPAYATPHMPRLDWQIWEPFVRFGDNRWLVSFFNRLMHGTPEVLALLDRNPFPGTPPKYIRLAVYQYHFTTAAERRRAATGGAATWTTTPPSSRSTRTQTGTRQKTA